MISIPLSKRQTSTLTPGSGAPPVFRYAVRMLALFFAAIAFHTDFEGGNLGRVEQVSETRFRCHVNGETDQDGRNRQASWYYFRLDGAKDKALTIDMVDLPGEYNYKPTQGAITKDTFPFYSDDGKNWRRLDTVEYEASGPVLRLRVTPRSDRLWIAHQMPYTNANLTSLLDELHSHPHLNRTSIGRTPKRREIYLLTITDPAVPDSGKKVAWIFFRQHSWESGSSWTGEGAIRFLLSDSARDIRRENVFKIFPMSDPDGVARGGVRFNSRGYDLNRNWDTADERNTPEIAAQRRAILAWIDSGKRIDLLLTLHNDEYPEYLAGPPDTARVYEPLMRRFEAALARSRYFSATKPAAMTEESTTAGKPGRMSVVQGLYKDRKIPGFLIEQRIVRHPKLGHQPTAEDRKAFGADLVNAIVEAIRAN